MTARFLRRWLLLLALLTLPVPYLLGETELAPWIRLAFLTGIFCAVCVAEGGAALLFVGLGFGQLLVWGGLLYAGAWLTARLIVRLGSARAQRAVALLLTAALLAYALQARYATPMSSVRARSSLLGLFG